MTKRKSKLQEYIEAIVIALIVAFFIRTFVIQAYKIPSGSMKPTLLIGDHILVNKFIYGIKVPHFRNTLISIKEPKKGDIVVFIYPEDRTKDFIKRVIATSGDTVEIRNKKIYLNGRLYEESHGVYTDQFVIPGSIQPRDNFGPVTVPPSSIFVMGDNRDQSYDSRFWGFVDLKDVLGKAFIIYWSWDREDHGVRWNRFGNILH
ncbi:signal peptidase I [Syntrophus aciditrophicus]|jgi:signal peptidase I|uniref:Signal peptidase I n=1 Tax=Syntrophus aciditrophicus (strain SB) TaxID=56780 RepID=Q2LVH9_SYNAS|nr:signal peptidase I [Syntrophus aciditrophicus]ABC78086.1 signal peptidase I [Syntrophus aciditrophicus SB]OPY18923.1 MAG: Signal peptidase I P [Syntrophus sp. PtaB.Bin075]